MKKIIVGITGATGVIYGIRLLELLRDISEIEVHLVLSDWAKETIPIETGYSAGQVAALADVSHGSHNMGACIASGSFVTHAMVVLPCSMKTLSAVANGYADNLIARAADVMLKEGRPLILCPRETPLNAIHLENMLKLSRLGVKIVPPMPGFYNSPKSIDDLIRHHCMKILDQLQLNLDLSARWQGMPDPDGK